MAEAIDNRGPELMGVNIAFYAMALITCLLRCYVRRFVVDAFRTDDWLMVVSTIFFTLYATFSTVGTTFGTGRHHADLETDQVTTAMMVRNPNLKPTCFIPNSIYSAGGSVISGIVSL